MIRALSLCAARVCYLAWPALILVVTMVGRVYLILDHVILVFFFLSTTDTLTAVYISLQYPINSYISITHISLLFFSQHHYYRLNNFRIYFVDNEFEKIIT
jgi:hypothetical protein